MEIVKAKYCANYAERLFIANLDQDGVLMPYTVRWSKENDATNWTDTSSGQMDLLDTDDYITGLCPNGPYLVIFKSESYSIWYRTGVATNPIQRSSWRLGIGCPAPYSIVPYMGTVAWLGRDDFYTFNGDQAVAIGESIRHTFFDIVADSELRRVWAGANYLTYEIMWVANTIGFGKLAFVWNWKHNEWYIYQFADDITCLGRGVPSSSSVPPYPPRNIGVSQSISAGEGIGIRRELLVGAETTHVSDAPIVQGAPNMGVSESASAGEPIAMHSYSQAVNSITTLPGGSLSVSFQGVPSADPNGQGPFSATDPYCVKVANLNIGDGFILSEDYPGGSWGTISGISSASAWGYVWITSLTLSAGYTGTPVYGYNYIPGPPHGEGCILRTASRVSIV